MVQKQPKISCVFVNYNTKHLLKNAIRALLARLPSFPVQIIAVDNNSTDGTVTYIRSLFPHIDMVANNQNGGYAYGVNRGIERAEGEYILVCNPDLVFKGGELESLVAWMDTHPNVGCAGPKLISPDKSVQDSCFRHIPVEKTIFARRSPFKHTKQAHAIDNHMRMSDFDHAKSRPVDWLLGAVMMIRSDAIHAVGGMDERFWMYYEDVDWCRRFWDAGYEVWYIAEISIVHYFGQESRTIPLYRFMFNKVAREHLLSGLKYAVKWRNTPYPSKTV